MAELKNIMERGFVTREDIVCGVCGKTEEDLKKEDEKVFLVFVYGKLVCGRCAVKMTTPKICGCGQSNNGNAKFCNNCGLMLNG